MAFGAPRADVTLINLLITAGGAGLAWATTGPLRWLGVAIAVFGVFAGLMMGSWCQFLPKGRQPGRREDGPSETNAAGADRGPSGL